MIRRGANTIGGVGGMPFMINMRKTMRKTMRGVEGEQVRWKD
jgi:hypothetical protein